jgi:hypothetical protein
MILDLDRLPSSPHLVPAFKPALAGVDFLNLRQVNLDLMGECIPGTNNATRQVRAYSLITWVYWVYPKLLEKLGREDARSDELIHFREKVESLFVWGHKLAGLSGVPGISSKVPEPIRGRVDLRFSSWKRSRANTSLEAAVQYGPSLLDLGGLGLIRKVSPGIYACTRRGRKLAMAFDEHLRDCSDYDFLTDLSNLGGTEEQANNLLPYWKIDQTTPSESRAFRSILWDPTHAGEKSDRGRRAAMIELILDLLATSDRPLDLDEIRKCLALPELWRTTPLSDTMQRQSRSWLVLQLRQLQRFATESLMSWLESCLIDGGHQLPDDLVKLADETIGDDLEINTGSVVAESLGIVRRPFTSVSGFGNMVEKDPDWVSPWALSDELADAVWEEDDRRLSSGFYCLLLLNQCRPFLEKDDLLEQHLENGGASRQSLAHWFRIVDRFKERPLRELIGWTIKNLIVSQHLAVGTQRFDGEKIRLRMIIEEDGLESLVTRPWQPGPTPDRLAALMSLLEGCRIVTQDDNGAFRLV